MSDYTVTTDFSVKDGLSSGDPEKLILGADFDVEFDAIAVAANSKYDSADLASQAQAEGEASNTVLMTPLRVANWADFNAGIVGDLQALTSPGADRILFWDNGAAGAAFLTPGNGVEISTTNLQLSATLAGAGLAYATGVLSVNADQGVKVESDSVRLTDVTAAAGQPINVLNGTFSFVTTSLAELTAANMDQAADSYLVDDAGTLKLQPYDEAGIKVQTVTGTTDTLAQTDMNTFIEYTNAAAVAVTLNTGVGDVGNIVLIKQTGAGQVTVSGTATIESEGSLVATKATHSVIALVCIAANTWALFGNRA